MLGTRTSRSGAQASSLHADNADRMSALPALGRDVRVPSMQFMAALKVHQHLGALEHRNHDDRCLFQMAWLLSPAYNFFNPYVVSLPCSQIAP